MPGILVSLLLADRMLLKHRHLTHQGLVRGAGSLIVQVYDLIFTFAAPVGAARLLAVDFLPELIVFIDN